MFEFGQTPPNVDRVIATSSFFIKRRNVEICWASHKAKSHFIWKSWTLTTALGRPNSIFRYSKNPKGTYSKGFMRVDGCTYYLVHRHITIRPGSSSYLVKLHQMLTRVICTSSFFRKKKKCWKLLGLSKSQKPNNMDSCWAIHWAKKCLLIKTI